MAKLRPLYEVLRYSDATPDKGKVRRYYRVFRRKSRIPDRCDNPGCPFHTQELVWCGLRVPLILDHIDGCSNNNFTENLRLLCPICNDQLVKTRGGANRGRIRQLGHSGYAVRERGSQDHHIKVFDGAVGSDVASMLDA